MKRKKTARLSLTRDTLASISGGPYEDYERSAIDTRCVTLNRCVASQATCPDLT